jgi:hypothetical protein
MGYYDVLIATWETLSGDTDEKLAVLNNMTVQGPVVDVSVGDIESFLSLTGILSQIETWLETNTNISPTQIAAREMLRTINSPHISYIRMSNPMIYASVKGMVDLLVAASLITPTQENELFAIAQPNIPWATAPNGAGLPSLVTYEHLMAAGLI